MCWPAVIRTGNKLKGAPNWPKNLCPHGPALHGFDDYSGNSALTQGLGADWSTSLCADHWLASQASPVGGHEYLDRKLSAVCVRLLHLRSFLRFVALDSGALARLEPHFVCRSGIGTYGGRSSGSGGRFAHHAPVVADRLP